MIARRIMLCALACAAALLAAGEAQRQSLSHQADQHDRAVPAGRADRHHGAADRQVHHRQRRPAGGDREPPGRRLDHRLEGRRRLARPTATRCCSAPRARSRCALALRQRRHRSAQDVRADLELRAAAACDGGVGCTVPAKTIAEFVAYARANPGKVNYGAGLGTPPHSAERAVRRHGQARRHLRAVPRRGAAIIDLTAGRNHYIIDGTVHPDAADPGPASCARSRSRARRALARTARRADPGGIRLSRFHARRSGPAWWRRTARPRRRSTGSTP